MNENLQKAYSEIEKQIAIAKEAITKASEIAKQNGINLNISLFDNPEQEGDEWYDSWFESDGEDDLRFLSR